MLFDMKKIISIIIISLLIGCSFGVQGLFFEKPTEKTKTTGLGDVFFNLKMGVLMRLAKFPSLSACIIDADSVRNLQRKTLFITWDLLLKQLLVLH
jgi:hypothetical protein